MSSCPETYVEVHQSKCDRCLDNCVTCAANKTECLACSDGFVLMLSSEGIFDSGNCYPGTSCPVGWYEEDRTCELCHDGHCIECGSGPGICSKCEPGYLQFDESFGLYEVDRCYALLSCPVGTWLHGTTCRLECPQGTFKHLETLCEDCDIHNKRAREYVKENVGDDVLFDATLTLGTDATGLSLDHLIRVGLPISIKQNLGLFLSLSIQEGAAEKWTSLDSYATRDSSKDHIILEVRVPAREFDHFEAGCLSIASPSSEVAISECPLLLEFKSGCNDMVPITRVLHYYFVKNSAIQGGLSHLIFNYLSWTPFVAGKPKQFDDDSDLDSDRDVDFDNFSESFAIPILDAAQVFRLPRPNFSVAKGQIRESSHGFPVLQRNSRVDVQLLFPDQPANLRIIVTQIRIVYSVTDSWDATDDVQIANVQQNDRYSPEYHLLIPPISREDSFSFYIEGKLLRDLEDSDGDSDTDLDVNSHSQGRLLPDDTGSHNSELSDTFFLHQYVLIEPSSKPIEKSDEANDEGIPVWIYIAAGSSTLSTGLATVAYAYWKKRRILKKIAPKSPSLGGKMNPQKINVGAASKYSLPETEISHMDTERTLFDSPQRGSLAGL
eukprot:CAMPEP_0115000360 /NCGR_PEP_ID=MMETSP0216-20121206/16713_1 /TAXON_ID=223996 /ORGANISM="Protocruzia adherens, Strain Boccale" /LENGTH=607 /DNA_ID=CAMNT_0002365447 /DNA_START=294 /DNA_END=2117 /DNA_ORIENTATION=+